MLYEVITVYKEMDDNIVVLKLFPGINKQVVHSILNAPELKGVVLETYGSGNGLAQQWFLDELKRAIDKDITVLNVTQCVAGAVDMHQYQTGRITSYNVCYTKLLRLCVVCHRRLCLFRKTSWRCVSL